MIFYSMPSKLACLKMGHIIMALSRHHLITSSDGLETSVKISPKFHKMKESLKCWPDGVVLCKNLPDLMAFLRFSLVNPEN